VAAKKREYSSGFTLLELTLALSLATGLLTGFFLCLRVFYASLNTASAAIRGAGGASELLDRMTQDLDQATGFYASSSVLVDFQTPSGRVAYELVQRNGDPKDTVVMMYQGGTGTAALPVGGNGSTSWPIGPNRVIANFNPFTTTLLNETNTPTTGTVGLFSNFAAVPPNIQLQLVLQPAQDSQIQYVRAAATPRIYR